MWSSSKSSREAIGVTTGYGPGFRALDAYLRRGEDENENALAGIGL